MKDEIKKFFRGDVEDTDEVLAQYSHDASIFEMRPTLVLFPKDSQDIQDLVKWVKDNKSKYPDLSITPRAAGTCMSGGSINTSLILDVSRYMNKISDPKNVTSYTILPKFPNAKRIEIAGEITVEPGAFYRDMEKVTLAKDMLLPSYTASKSINAVGGMVGNNSAGELTLQYGQTCDYVKELKVVFSDGHEYVVRPLTRRELYQKIAQVDVEGKIYKEIFSIIENNGALIDSARPRVSKNSAGYYIWNISTTETTAPSNSPEDVFDLTKLIVGSQGTLGIVTEITFRLVKNPAHSKLVTVFLKDLTHLGDIVDEILLENPTTIESYDDKTFDLAVKFFPDLVKTKGLFSTLAFGISFLPEFMMTLTGGVPKLILLVEFTGDDEKVLLAKAQTLEQKIAHFGLKTRTIIKNKEAEKYWTMRRDSFALLRKHTNNRRTAPFIDDIIVPPQVLPEFLPKLHALMDQYPSLIYTIAGHAGNGNFHIIPLMDFHDKNAKTIIIELSQKVYDLVISYGGSITGEHNDGLIRTPFLERMFGHDVVGIFMQIKRIFDPNTIFNPKKKVGATIADIETYMVEGEVPHVHHSS